MRGPLEAIVGAVQDDAERRGELVDLRPVRQVGGEPVVRSDHCIARYLVEEFPGGDHLGPIRIAVPELGPAPWQGRPQVRRDDRGDRQHPDGHGLQGHVEVRPHDPLANRPRGRTPCRSPTPARRRGCSGTRSGAGTRTCSSTLVNSTRALIAATLGSRRNSQANGAVIWNRYQGRSSLLRCSTRSVGLVIAVSITPRGPPNGIRHPLRVGTPIRLRITTYIATSMNATLPTIVRIPIRRSRLIATQIPSGTRRARRPP